MGPHNGWLPSASQQWAALNHPPAPVFSWFYGLEEVGTNLIMSSVRVKPKRKSLAIRRGNKHMATLQTLPIITVQKHKTYDIYIYIDIY